MKKLIILAAIVLLVVAAPSFAKGPHTPYLGNASSGGGGSQSQMGGQAQAYTTITPEATNGITTGIPVTVGVTATTQSGGGGVHSSGPGQNTTFNQSQNMNGSQNQTVNTTLGGGDGIGSSATQYQSSGYTTTQGLTANTNTQ